MITLVVTPPHGGLNGCQQAYLQQSAAPPVLQEMFHSVNTPNSLLPRNLSIAFCSGMCRLQHLILQTSCLWNAAAVYRVIALIRMFVRLTVCWFPCHLSGL
jgi:hypothetical protein